VIFAPVPPRSGSAGDRLLEALARRGHAAGQTVPPAEATLFLCPAPGQAGGDLEAARAILARVREPRWLLVTRLGTHPDATQPALRACWALEEFARGTGRPTLVLRLGPLLGPESPLWRRLRSAPSLPRGGAKLLNPVCEADAVETLDRALSDRAEWSGWYELAGPEVWSLAGLAALARQAGPALPAGSGAWEPPLAELEEHRLAEAKPWLEHFRLSVRPLGEQARGWAAAPAGRPA
jgi:uncharacterized protein YbjT (DUF2867 family)